MLKDVSGGAEPSKTDLQIIEEIMFSQKLLPGVINVLIQYVMLKTDMKLTKGYMEKIAGQWVRKNIRTVKEAMALAKKEHKQYMEWAQGKKIHSRSQPEKLFGQKKFPNGLGKIRITKERRKRREILLLRKQTIKIWNKKA